MPASRRVYQRMLETRKQRGGVLVLEIVNA